jgi:hypothetical protein
MKKVCFILPVFCCMLSSVVLGQEQNVMSKNSLPESKEKKFSVGGGGSFTSELWGADVTYRLGLGFCGSAILLGTYDGFGPADVPPENIFTTGLGGGWGIPGKWKEPWGGFEGSGVKFFASLVWKKRSYTNFSYQTGYCFTLAHDVIFTKSFSLYGRYIHSTFDSYHDEYGLKGASENFDSDGMYWGGTLFLPF